MAKIILPILVLGIAHLKIFLQELFMPENVWTQGSLATTCSSGQCQWPIESDLNTDSIDIWFVMLWKDMEVPSELNLMRNLAERRTLTENGGWLFMWLAKGKVIVLYISIKSAFHCFLQLGNMCFSSWDIIFFVTSGFRESKAVSVGQISKISKWNFRG